VIHRLPETSVPIWTGMLSRQCVPWERVGTRQSRSQLRGATHSDSIQSSSISSKGSLRRMGFKPLIRR
jgi:hypothetical protein